MLYWMPVQGNLSRQKKDQELLNYQETGGTGKPVAPGYQGYPGNPRTLGSSEDRRQNLATSLSTDCVPHMNKVFSIVRQTYGRSPTDDLKDLDVNTAIWGIFMSVTLQAAVHLGQDYTENLRSTKNQPLKSAGQWFQTTEKFFFFLETSGLRGTKQIKDVRKIGHTRDNRKSYRITATERETNKQDAQTEHYHNAEKPFQSRSSIA